MEEQQTLGLGLNFKVDADGYIIAPDGEDFGLPVETEAAAQGRTRDVELPSGNLTRLEVPGLACLLWAGASKDKLAKAIWRHPQGEIELFALDDAEIDFIYEWGLVEFAKMHDSLNLASLCKLYHVAPSMYIGVADKMTAYLFDTTVSATMGEEEARQMKVMERQSKRGGPVQLPPDPQEVRNAR